MVHVKKRMATVNFWVFSLQTKSFGYHGIVTWRRNEFRFAHNKGPVSYAVKIKYATG